MWNFHIFGLQIFEVRICSKAIDSIGLDQKLWEWKVIVISYDKHTRLLYITSHHRAHILRGYCLASLQGNQIGNLTLLLFWGRGLYFEWILSGGGIILFMHVVYIILTTFLIRKSVMHNSLHPQMKQKKVENFFTKLNSRRIMRRFRASTSVIRMF